LFEQGPGLVLVKVVGRVVGVVEHAAIGDEGIGHFAVAMQCDLYQYLAVDSVKECLADPHIIQWLVLVVDDQHVFTAGLINIDLYVVVFRQRGDIVERNIDGGIGDRKSTRLNSIHVSTSSALIGFKKKLQ